MQPESAPHNPDAAANAKQAPLWQVAFLIMAIVFGPAFIAGILTLLR